MRDPNATLAKFGMDPEKIVEKRMRRAVRLHDHIFDSIGGIVGEILSMCDHCGFGNASRLHVLRGAAEPPLFALAISITYPPDIEAAPGDKIPLDSLVFAGLFLAHASENAAGRAPEAIDNAMHDTHTAFEKLTGRLFRDCFIDTCGCATCKQHRKRTGIKLNPDRTDRWI